MRRSMMAAMAVALASAGAMGGPAIEIPTRKAPKLVGPKYKPEKPRKNRSLRRIKGR